MSIEPILELQRFYYVTYQTQLEMAVLRKRSRKALNKLRTDLCYSHCFEMSARLHFFKEK